LKERNEVMKSGFLSTYFEGVAAKRLSAVETDLTKSHQHEFNGVADLKKILGTEKQTFEAQFIYLGDDEKEVVLDTGEVTWYDARERHPVRTEYRCYYTPNAVIAAADKQDLMIFAKKPSNNVLIVVVKENSTYESQLLWLFGLAHVSSRFTAKSLEDSDIELGFAARYILEQIGIEIEFRDETWLNKIISRFGERFPKTKDFSAFARETVPDINPRDNPDLALQVWMDQEELLFRTLENHLVYEKISQGFETVDEFIAFSLSVHNRRKSRVGYALENHLEQIFKEFNLRYSRNAKTENKVKPDFLFPGIEFYRNKRFPEMGLTMLGVKSTCKDRWRQVLSEAARIKSKHLLTLEPGISEDQTSEMQNHLLQLVVPSYIQPTYKESQRSWLVDLGTFIKIVQDKQTRYISFNSHL